MTSVADNTMEFSSCDVLYIANMQCDCFLFVNWVLLDKDAICFCLTVQSFIFTWGQSWWAIKSNVHPTGIKKNVLLWSSWKPMLTLLFTFWTFNMLKYSLVCKSKKFPELTKLQCTNNSSKISICEPLLTNAKMLSTNAFQNFYCICNLRLGWFQP